jgi:hypothetical protein
MKRIEGIFYPCWDEYIYVAKTSLAQRYVTLAQCLSSMYTHSEARTSKNLDIFARYLIEDIASLIRLPANPQDWTMYADLFARLTVLINTEGTQYPPNRRLRGQNTVDFVPAVLKSFRKSPRPDLCMHISVHVLHRTEAVPRSSTLFRGKGVSTVYGRLACLHSERAELKVSKANKMSTRRRYREETWRQELHNSLVCTVNESFDYLR